MGKDTKFCISGHIVPMNLEKCPLCNVEQFHVVEDWPWQNYNIVPVAKTEPFDISRLKKWGPNSKLSECRTKHKL